MAISTRAQLRVIVAGAVIIFFSLFYFRSSLHVEEHIDSLTTLYDAKENVESEVSDSPLSSPVPTVLSLPEAYTSRPKQDEFCSALFSPAYLDNLSRNRTSFCDPSGSTSTLECFSTRIVKGRLDTLCIASNVAFHRRKRKFYMDCAHDPENPFYKVFPEYMMWTGLQYIFKEHIGLKDPERLQRSREKRSSEAKKFGVVARREGAGSPHGSAANVWHNLVELMSYYMTLDVLSMSTSPHAEDKGAAYYNSEVDKANTQVIVVDGHKKGPYFDLWDFFSDPTRNPTLKLSEDAKVDAEAEEQEDLEFFDRVVLPLPGASNPFWEGTWTPHHCSQSDLGRVFSERVLTHYNAMTTDLHSLDEKAMDLSALPPKWPKKISDPLQVLIVKRATTRRIDDLEGKLAALKKLYPSVVFNVRDLSDYTFAEQVRMVHSHQILVGVHGAAMTHLFFLPGRPNAPSSTVVEILPHKLGHRGYRNLALMMGHRYISVHADNDMEGKDFHGLDLEVENSKYVDAVGTAIKASFHRGLQEMDIETVKTA
ncbi:hypothetical protein KCV07_g6326, partial [Aureobasidium melanogenum]